MEKVEKTNELWGDCRVTAYCPCEICCGEYALRRPRDSETGKPIVYGASGEVLTSYRSCASSLPFGTKLYIPGLDLHLVVEDRAAQWVDEKYEGMYVDIYIDDHNACYELLDSCEDYMEVYIEHE